MEGRQGHRISQNKKIRKKFLSERGTETENLTRLGIKNTENRSWFLKKTLVTEEEQPRKKRIKN